MNEEEFKIVMQYKEIHKELESIKKTMSEMERRSHELLVELEKLRKLEKNKIKNGKEKRI